MPEPNRTAPPTRSADAQPRPIKNVLSNWSAFFVTAVVAFFLSPFVVRSLGNNEYGAWVLLGSLVGYMGLLDLGVRGAVTRFIAKFHAEGDHHQSSQLASSAFFIFFLSGLIAIIVAVLLALFVVPAFRIPVDLVSKAKLVVIIGGATIAVTLVNGVFEGIIVGRQRFDYTSGITIVAEGLRATLIVIALSAGEGIVALAIIQFVIGLLRTCVAYGISRRLYPEARIRFAGWDSSAVRMIFSFGISTILLQASGQITMYTDSLVISAFLPIGLLTFFAIAVNLTIYARSIVRGISFTLTPMTSALKAQGQHDELRRVALKGARFATLMIAPIVLTFMLRGSSFIGLWMGPSYAQLSGEVLWILAIALMCEGGFGSIGSTMYGLNRHKGLIPILATEAAVNLGLSIWLVQRIGIHGVAWGTVAPRLVVALLAMPWYLKRVLGVPIPTFWFDAWVRPLSSMIPFALGTYAVQQMWPASNLVMFFSQVILVLPLAALGGWFICLTHDERHTYGTLIAQRLRPGGSRA